VAAITAVHATGRQIRVGEGNLPLGNSKKSIVAARSAIGNEAQLHSHVAYGTLGSERALSFVA